MSSRRALPQSDAIRRLLPTVALGIGGALMAAGAWMVALYAVPSLQLVHPYAVMASAFIPYGIVAFAGSAVIFAASPRRWVRPVAVAAVAGMLLQGWWAKPYWPAAAPEPGAGSFTLVTMNMRCDLRGLAELAALVARERPDMLVVQGLRAAKQATLGGEGEGEGRLPYSTYFPMPKQPACGTAVFSRTSLRSLSGPGDAQSVVEVNRPEGPLVLLPVDLPTPTASVAPWLDAFSHLTEAVTAHEGRPLVAAGDFNAVREHQPLRQLLADTDLRDAAEVAGAGWTPTFSSSALPPPFVGLDHVLVSEDIQSASVATAPIAGQSHHALMARFVCR